MRPAFGGRAPREADVVVVGRGLSWLVTALEVARRGSRVVAVTDAEAEAAPRGLGLALLGPGRPYQAVARTIGRAAAQLVWAAGCENHLRLKAFVEQSGSGCGYTPRGSFLLARDRREAEELAESEDMLRDDGFPGEFLDHYMLETRFDLSGFPAAYWAAEDAELSPVALATVLEQAGRAAGVGFAPGRARALRCEKEGVVVELESGLMRGEAVALATDGPAAGLVPELAPLLRPRAVARLSLPPLAGATLPGAARTAEGRIAWQAEGLVLHLAETGLPPRDGLPYGGGLPPRDGLPYGGGLPPADGLPYGGGLPPDPLHELATRLPLDLAAARATQEEGELPVDGFPLIGRLAGRPLAVACGFAGLSPGLAFAAARWVTDALLRGNDPTPATLRATRTPPEA